MFFYLTLLFGSLYWLLRKKEKRAEMVYPLPQSVFKTVKGKKGTFSVLSYNLLAYKFTRAEWYPKTDTEALHPKFRAPRILQEIREINADIVGLQECDMDLFLDYYLPNLKAAGYDVVFKKSSNLKNVNSVLCYKTASFSLKDTRLINLDEELVKLCESFSRQCEAQLARLVHKNTGASLLVANTHLYWNPELEYVKYGQLMKIFEHIENEKRAGDLIVLVGDLNSLPESNVLKYVYKVPPEVTNENKSEYNKNQFFMDKFYKENLHSLAMRSAYDEYSRGENMTEKHPLFTAKSENFQGCLDYILYDEKGLEVTKLLRVNCDDEEISNFGLPNSKYPSDHMKVAAEFAIR